MSEFKNITNKKFGHLTALYVDKTRHGNHTYWVCRCDCGKIRSLQLHQLTSGSVTSCGCFNTGGSRRKIKPELKRLYSLYNSMLSRCLNPSNIKYKYYGGKGISVCPEWKNSFDVFSSWALSNGYNDNLSIDRIDNNLGYNPDNCRWVTIREQHLNTKTSVIYSHNGEIHNMVEWCKILNFPYSLAKSRRKEAKKKNINPSFEYVFAPKKYKSMIKL